MGSNQGLDIKIKLKNFKCFGKDPQGFSNLYPINIIIGKNNSGKSALLDGIKYMTSPYEIQNLGHKKNTPEIFYTVLLNEGEIETVFKKNTSGGGVPGGRNHFQYGLQWKDSPITLKLHPNKQKEFIHIDPMPPEKIKQAYIHKMAGEVRIPLLNKQYRFLAAERNIAPEADGNENLALESDGNGATTLIRRFVNDTKFDRSIVEKKLLSALNEIFEPDATFTRILPQQHTETKKWEIFLEEEGKGSISLSDSGSGLKTIILVLLNLILVPELDHITMGAKPEISSYIFAFEELENNLHPGLQRRLLRYIRKYIIENKCLLFLTTHSSVVIDMFSKAEEAQIIHVAHHNGTTAVKTIKTYVESRGIIDDLDIRASDILQTNGLIWVEGPSDRLLINRWIELLSDGHLKEHTHYQCILYGGKLLNHLSADDPETAEAIGIFRINSNAVVIMDRDRGNSTTPVNNTKLRIEKELSDIGGHSWITAGREIENYLPQEAIDTHYEKKLTSLKRFQKFGDYLEKTKGTKEKNRFLRGKISYAEKFSNFITKENMNVHDLNSEIEKIIKLIRKWNKME